MTPVKGYKRNTSFSRFLSTRAAHFPTFASDGQRLAFITDITGVPQVWQIKLPDTADPPPWPDQLTFESDRVMGAWFSPVPGDGRLIYARDTGGNENMQLYLLSADGSSERSLTAGHEKAMHIFGEWSKDGDEILFAANRRDPGLFDLYIQPLDGEARLVWQNEKPGFLFELTFSPEEDRVVLSRMASSFDHALIEVNLETGTSRQLMISSEDVSFTSVCYSPDGRSLYINSDKDSDFLHILRLDLETLEAVLVTAPGWDTGSMTLSPNGRYLAYDVNVEGASELHLLDLTSGATRIAPGLSEVPGVISMMDWGPTFSPDSTLLAFSFTSANRTSDIFVWELAADQVTPVTRSSHGGIPNDQFIVPELVHYPTFDSIDGENQRQIPAWFFKPAGQHESPVPAIIVVHGGPEAQFRTYFNFFIQYVLQQGYAVLAPNVRGSTGYGNAYSHLDDVEKRMDSVADLAHATYWLKERPEIDGDRLVVNGGSYGGFMVLSALTTYPDLWAAAVDIVGISSFVTFLENTSSYRRAHREAEYGSLEHNREFLETISPINHVDAIIAPLMVIHGANDPRVPLSEAEQLVEALKVRDVPVQLLVFDDEGHGIAKLKNKLVAYPAIVDFLDKHLAG